MRKVGEIMPKLIKPPEDKEKNILQSNIEYLCKIQGVSIKSLCASTKLSAYQYRQCRKNPGKYTYDNMDDLIEVCVKLMANENYTPEQVREHLKTTLPGLNYWKRYAQLGGEDNFDKFKAQIIDEFNALNIEGMPEVKSLNTLEGSFVNLEYTLPNGKTVKFLDDNSTYLGNQLECEFGGDRCFGIIANMDFLLVCTYEENGENPELVIYKKR